MLAAEELAAGLKRAHLDGIGEAQVFDGKDFREKIAGKKGIIFFKDYWMRSADNPGSPTGDHIDLWNGSRLTDLSSWVRVRFGLTIPDVWSDFEKSKHIAFWKVDE